MNGYDTLLHYIAPGKYIVIKVEYGLQFTSKYFLTNQIEKTTTKIIIKMLMILDFKIVPLWFVIEYNSENNWFLNVLVKSNLATPTPFGSVSCFVIGICLSNYKLNSFLIHQASYPKEYQWYLMHRIVLGRIWKIVRYTIKVSDVLCYLIIHKTLEIIRFSQKTPAFGGKCRGSAAMFACTCDSIMLHWVDL